MSTSGEGDPILSVVIPTLGRASLVKTLESLVRNPAFPSLQIIVSGRIHDPGVRSAVEEIIRAHRNIVHLPVEFPEGDSSRKKNAGAERAEAEFIAFLDDDVVVTEQWPRRIREPFTDPAVGLVSGPGLLPPDTRGFARLAGGALQSLAAGYVAGRYTGGRGKPRLIRWSQIIGCNMVYRASVFREIGGFDPAFWPGEEMIAAYRTQQKHRIVFHPEAPVYHAPRQTLRGFWRQMWGYGATRIRLIRGGAPVEWSTLFPMGWVASLLVLGLAAPWSSAAAALLGLDLAAYLAGDAVVSILKGWQTRRVGDLGIFLIVPVMHVAYGLAEWYEFFSPGRDLSRRV